MSDVPLAAGPNGHPPHPVYRVVLTRLSDGNTTLEGALGTPEHIALTLDVLNDGIAVAKQYQRHPPAWGGILLARGELPPPQGEG